MARKKGPVGRGFNLFRKHVEDSGIARYIASCSSCKFQDDELGCTNNNVTEFDMVKEEETGRVYCVYYRGHDVENKRRKKSEDDW